MNMKRKTFEVFIRLLLNVTSVCSGHYINVDVNHVKSTRHFCNKIWQAFRFTSLNLGGSDFLPVATLPQVSIFVIIYEPYTGCPEIILQKNLNFFMKLNIFFLPNFFHVFAHTIKRTSVRMAMRLQSAPSIQPLNKYCLHTSRTTHQQNELLVKRCVGLLQRYIKTWYIHTYINNLRPFKLVCSLHRVLPHTQFLHWYPVV